MFDLRPLVMLALLVPLAAAQEAVMVLEDPSSDVSAPPMAATMDHVDLRSLHVSDQEGNLSLALALENLDAGSQADQTRYEIGFNHENVEFRVRGSVGRELDGAGFGDAHLDQRPLGSDVWMPAGELEDPAIDVTDGVVGVLVPLDRLRDEDATAPFSGRELQGFWARAESARTRACVTDDTLCTTGLASFYDVMPDSGVGTVSYVVQGEGVAGLDTLIEVERPRRSSNGEETTFVFLPAVVNQGQEARTYTIEATGMPDDWDVHVPIEAFVLEPEERRELPVIAAIPFNHRHGQAQSFQVTVADVEDASHSLSTELGVTFLAVPQPAGHHDTVYLHSTPSRSAFPRELAEGDQVSVYMNTLKQDPASANLPSRPEMADEGSTGGFTGTVFRWCIPLRPHLLIGMDWDQNQEGTGSFTLRAPQAPFQGELSGGFWIAGPDDGGHRDGGTCTQGRPPIKVAEIGSMNLAIPSGQEIEIQVPIAPLPEGDFIPEQAGQDLFLELRFDTAQATFGANELPVLKPGGWFELPLHEYHEPLHTTGLSVHVVSSTGSTNAIRSPGTAALFHLQVALPDAQAQVFGTRAEWSRIIPGPATPGSSSFYVAVEIPQDTPDRVIANLVIRFQSINTDEVHLARVVVEVDLGGAHPDDTQRISELFATPERRVPAIGWVSVGLVLAVILRTRR